MRVDLLTKESQKKGKAGQRFTNLIEYFNSNLFPSDESSENNEMDEEERDLYQAIEEDDEGDVTADNN